MPETNIVEHTATIAAAYLGNNTVAADQVSAIIASIHAALGGLGMPTATALPAVLKPAIPVRRSIEPHAITCLDCGYSGQMLKRHLSAHHGLTPDEYRARWRLAADYPVVAPNYAVKRSTLAKQIGLGTRTRSGRR